MSSSDRKGIEGLILIAFSLIFVKPFKYHPLINSSISFVTTEPANWSDVFPPLYANLNFNPNLKRNRNHRGIAEIAIAEVFLR